MSNSNWKNGLIGAIAAGLWAVVSIEARYLNESSIIVRIWGVVNNPFLELYGVIFQYLCDYRFTVYDDMLHRSLVWIGIFVFIGFILGLFIPAVYRLLRSKISRGRWEAKPSDIRLSFIVLCWAAVIVFILGGLILYRRFDGVWGDFGNATYFPPALLNMLLSLSVCVWVGMIFRFSKLNRKEKILSRINLCLGIIAISITGLAFVPYSSETLCDCNLKMLGGAIRSYEFDHHEYPFSIQWNDLLSSYTEAVRRYVTKNPKSGIIYLCPNAEGDFDFRNRTCSYAMNPNVEPNSPPEVVLLFESKSGWNQSGEVELLMPENHSNRGCNVLFNDLHVEFIKKSDFYKLRWE